MGDDGGKSQILSDGQLGLQGYEFESVDQGEELEKEEPELGWQDGRSVEEYGKEEAHGLDARVNEEGKTVGDRGDHEA